VLFIPQLSNIIQFSHTATADTKFRLVQNDLWIKAANIHVVTNAAYYGDTNNQSGAAAANSVITFEDFNLADLFFKNAAAGVNTTIVAICVLATERYKKQVLGVE